MDLIFYHLKFSLLNRKPKYKDQARKADTSSLKDGIEALLDAYKLRGKFNETSIVANWEKLMGPQIAKRTSQIFVRNKKLYLKLTSAPLKHELVMAKSKLIDLMNENHEEKIIEDVVFL